MGWNKIMTRTQIGTGFLDSLFLFLKRRGPVVYGEEGFVNFAEWLKMADLIQTGKYSPDLRNNKIQHF